ncbi:MAG: T9SS type A sorting domain-containing protein, partial [Bacteroidota bacterium]
GDLDQDILIAGLTHSLKRITKLYVNDGAGFFSELSGNTLEGVEAGAILLMDIDSDSDKDVLITGRNNDLTQVGRIYLNTTHESPVTHLISNQGAGLTLYPNPSETGEIFIDYTAEEVGEVNLRIFNMNGQLLNQVRKPLNIGKQTLQMDISALSRGNYIIQVEDALGTRSQLFSTL